MRKLTINGPFSIAISNYKRVAPWDLLLAPTTFVLPAGPEQQFSPRTLLASFTSSPSSSPQHKNHINRNHVSRDETQARNERKYPRFFVEVPESSLGFIPLVRYQAKRTGNDPLKHCLNSTLLIVISWGYQISPNSNGLTGFF